MTPSKGLFVASLSIAALLAVTWIAGHRGSSSTPSVGLKSVTPPAVADATAALPSPETAVATPTPKPHTAGSAHVLPDSLVPFDEAIPLLLEAAESGDPITQIELSTRLSICTGHALRAAEASDESDRDSIEGDKTNQQLDDHLRTARAANGQARIDQHASDRHSCSQLPADLRTNWLKWIDKAAQVGNTSAMLQYARLSVAEYDSVGAIVADVDTAIERRDKARSYLLNAMQLGEQQALRELAYGYFERTDNFPRVFPVDPLQSYAYAYAGTLAGVSNRGDLDWVMSKNAEKFDARQLAEAQALGRSIYERCCGKH